MQEYIALVQRKGQQIKALTDRLLDSGSRDLETIEDGKLLMEQLAGEWEEILENTFPCIVDTKNCPAFYGSFDIRSCGGSLIILLLMWKNMRIGSSLWNCGSMLWINAFGSAKGMESKTGTDSGGEQSNRLESIRRIAALYGGMVKVSIEQGIFSIQITLSEVDGSHL